MNCAVVIPCYNEAARLPTDRFLQFLNSEENCTIIFSNDGSSDGTEKVLEKIKQQFPEKVAIIALEKNSGKAEAVRTGTIWALANIPGITKIGYLDADLSTSLEEWFQISKKIEGDIRFAYGSRILKIDTDIRRKTFRHYTGRIVATCISSVLKMKAYDTQCGCKVMAAELARRVYSEPFISRWLFDVEIFLRISKIFGKHEMKNICREIPLKKWTDVEDSKVKMTYFFKLWRDLFLIDRKYNHG